MIVRASVIHARVFLLLLASGPVSAAEFPEKIKTPADAEQVVAIVLESFPCSAGICVGMPIASLQSRLGPERTLYTMEGPAKIRPITDGEPKKASGPVHLLSHVREANCHGKKVVWLVYRVVTVGKDLDFARLMGAFSRAFGKAEFESKVDRRYFAAKWSGLNEGKLRFSLEHYPGRVMLTWANQSLLDC